MFQNGSHEKFWREISSHIRLACPVSITFLLRKSIDIISLVFVGHLVLTNDQLPFLSGAGLGTVTGNITGNSMLIGLSGALATLCSQANGARDLEALGLALQRGILILLCMCIPITVLWANSKAIIILLGQEDSIADSSSKYLHHLIPGVWAYSCSICIQNWLYAQERTRIVAIIVTIVALFHPLWVYLFIYVFSFGYIGAAIAISCSRILELCLLLSYLRLSTVLTDTNFQVSKKCLTGWMPFLRLGLPNLIMMSEWWASEAIIFMAGLLPNPSLQIAAMSIYQNINSICFMFPSGFGVSGSSRVGNHLGADDAESAKTASIIAPLLAGSVSFAAGMLLVVFRNSFGYIFTSDDAVNSNVSYLLLVLSLYVFADGVQSALTGVLKGLGKQGLAGPIVLFAYYGVGIPLSALLAFTWGYGLGSLGLCVGVLVGTWVHMCIYIAVVSRVDWAVELVKTKDRLNSTKGPSTSGLSGDVDDSDEWWSMGFEMHDAGVATKRDESYLTSIIGMLGIRQANNAEYELVQEYTEALDDSDLILEEQPS